VFHLMGALSEFGKLGLTCIGDSPPEAEAFYNQVMQVLDHETTGIDNDQFSYPCEPISWFSK